MSIQGNDGFLDLENASLRVTGNVHAEGLKVGSVRLQPAYSLQSVTNISNTTTQMVQFTNPTKGFDVTSNIEVGDANLYVDTTTGRVGVGTNAPMGTLDVKGVLNHTQVANVAQITSNSNVVMEYRRSKKLIKYPRVYLTSAALNSAYENGYRVTFSHESTSFRAYHAFSLDEVSAVGWYTNDGSGSTIEYNGTSGAYNGTTRLATETDLGEWIGLELPEAIKLYDLQMVSQSYSTSINTIDNFIVYAKKQSGDTWTELGRFTGMAAYQNTADGVTVNVNAVDYYKFFAIVATKRFTTANGVSIRRLDLYGTPEYDPEAHGTDVVLHTTPNVPNTDFFNVYYDGQDYTSTPATVADKSGNGITGTPSGGVGFDTTYKAFTFDGVDDKITATLTNPAGAWVHSASMWFKVNSLSAINTLFSIDNNTAGENNRTPIFDIHTDGSLRYEFWGNAIYFGGPGTIDRNKWYHVSVTYSGGSDTSSRKLFLNGVELSISSTVGTIAALNAHANAILKIGVYPASTFPFNGSIANFRLYNRALSADEIWELYAYQKEYFGVSPDVVTLKAGRVGIGTSEPRAVLDVRGDIRGGCPVYFSASSAAATGTGTFFNFDSVHENKGGGLHGTTFTAPIAGLYYFSFFCTSDWQSVNLSGGRRILIYWYKNNSHHNSGNDGLSQLYSQDPSYSTFMHMNTSISAMFQLNKDDIIQIKNVDDTAIGFYNCFSGFYLSS